MYTIGNNIDMRDEFEELYSDFSQSHSTSQDFKQSLQNKLVHEYRKNGIFTRFFLPQPKVLFAAAFGLILIFFLFSFQQSKHNTITIKPPEQKIKPTFLAKKDDWVFSQNNNEESSLSQSKANIFNMAPQMGLRVPAADANLGFATGGAKDISNFRENIKNGYLPLPTDITHEGLFYDYYFDTGKLADCSQLFCPSYSYAVSKDPFSQQKEYYMTVGLNSGLKANEFQRKNLNLVVVLDISGSMSAPFDQYYYDGKNKPANSHNLFESQKSKMQVANEAIVGILDHLQPEDRLGIVLFDQEAYLAKPLNYMGETDAEALKKHILSTREQGSTNHGAGYRQGTELFQDFSDLNNPDYENRIIFVTDAMPNTGTTGRDSLPAMVQDQADKKIYTTFIGVGIDFNSELIEGITKARGANYYSVHSAQQFKNRMDDEFEYMVTPLVFNLSLSFQSDSWEIQKVYGSREADSATGTLMKVNTLFPSASNEQGVKGGIVLLKLRKIGGNSPVRLNVSYQGRDGKREVTTKTAILPDGGEEYYQNSGIRKAILLTRYTTLMKNFILSKRSTMHPLPMDIQIFRKEGLPVWEDQRYSQWERASMPLSVTLEDKEIFIQFKSYFQKEMQSLGDRKLDQEISILSRFIE
ncbi:hypothetical protein A3F60_03010 [Candidatus Roizmanbacteria bacterium RIFCSPHIGHO2_12_FULL_39_8]|uniref:VWFA domain-containing protein n=1 Tax=Candidatus Roizmanbacteria bacterium RIFCSPHIGHO2_12_FULL_39_8 TaxID=1802050 RepID=A0A1F7I497_9BACT|nr:MAG: hypothetical protein A3F60_03010 [Candidatus Roizmanbacteria bacterium RIFCSPHIGHO2_12_FULL_39_8]